jgi:hypothetical protein
MFGIGRQKCMSYFYIDDGEKENVPNNIDSEKSTAQKISTRQWAENNDYNAHKLFQKVLHYIYLSCMNIVVYFMQLFENDIEYLLSMEKLWQKRRRPTPLKLSTLSDAIEQGFYLSLSLSYTHTHTYTCT